MPPDDRPMTTSLLDDRHALDSIEERTSYLVLNSDSKADYPSGQDIERPSSPNLFDGRPLTSSLDFRSTPLVPDDRQVASAKPAKPKPK